MSIALVLGQLAGSSSATACPAAIFGIELPALPHGPRKGLRLFVKDTRDAWQAVPLQVDPVDHDGHLVFYKDQNFLGRELDTFDYVTFRAEDFGRRFVPKKDKLPCRGSLVYELRDEAGQRYAYLTNCAWQATPAQYPDAVTFDKSGHVLQSPVYRYKFNPANYMQFEEISFKTPAGAWERVATDSRMLIRADVKKFFTMNFDHHHIQSDLEASRIGPVGDLARLSFFLQILFFRIRMSLSTDVGFYTDSSHIPMMVNIPVNAFDYLHPRSGILYSWVLTDQAAVSPRDVHMPALDVPLIEKGFQELGKTGLKYCDNLSCDYHYTVDVKGQRLAMDLGMKKELVARGFFPIFVEDVATASEAMGWEIEVPKGVKRVGMYFEVSGLPEGGHPWDFWLRLGSPSDRPKTCPAPVHFARLADEQLR